MNPSVHAFVFAFIVLINKTLYIFYYSLENEMLFLFRRCTVFSYFSEDLDDGVVVAVVTFIPLPTLFWFL